MRCRPIPRPNQRWGNTKILANHRQAISVGTSLVTNVEEDNSSGKSGGWTDSELEAAIEAYDEMLRKLDSGEIIVKARYYEHLVELHG